MLLAWVLLWFVGVANACGDGEPLPVAEREVVAQVGTRPIYADQVERELRRVLRGRTVEPSAAAQLRAEALKLLVDRQKILAWLESQGRAATPADLDLAIRERQAEVVKRRGSWEQFLRDQEMYDEQDLRESLRWQLSWRRFLDRYLTDENLERYFREHRRDFDGTRIRVAHIRLKVDPDQPQAWDAVEQQAAVMLRQIRSGNKTFATLAQETSAAPTATQGGELGWIERRRPMVESFSQAAFALEPGQVSEPVRTPFGIHLIHCLEVEPGQRSWRDARAELETAVTQFLFRWTAQRAANL